MDYGNRQSRFLRPVGTEGRRVVPDTAEHYYGSRRTGRQKTDGEYVEDLRRLAGERTVQRVIADPSAASFILALRRAGFRVEKARNDVADGIRVTADLLQSGAAGDLRGLRRPAAGDGAVLLGRAGGPGRPPEGARPRHG